MRKQILLVPIFVLLGILGLAAPTLAVFGDYHLIESPTPYSLSVNRWELGIHSFSNNPWIAEMKAGVAPGLTLGLDAVENNGAGLNLKYQVLGEKSGSPAVAIGADDIGRDTTSPYLVIGDQFPGGSPLRWHVGIGGGRYDGIFLGLDANLTKQGKGGLPVELKAELVNDNINLGVSLGFAPGWKLDIASAEDDLLAGVSYRASF